MKKALLTVLIVVFLLSCSVSTDKAGQNVSFKNIPGVTDEEIGAIEALLQQRQFFEFGMTLSAEAFHSDNVVKGYAALFCGWMTELFGIPFIPIIYEKNDLAAGLNSGKIDFTGDLPPSKAGDSARFETSAIAQRTIKYFRIKNSRALSEIAADRPLRFIFLNGSAAYEHVTASENYKNIAPIFIEDYRTVYGLLKNGEADAFLEESVMEIAFDDYADIVAEDIFPLAFRPVVLSTRNENLKPIISAAQKALKNGGELYLAGLYNQGRSEYLKQKLSRHLNDDEKMYIMTNPVVTFMAEFDNYPLCFYNDNEKQWQGIAFDVMEEIERLTNITFKLVNSSNQRIAWPEMVRMLEYGEVCMLTELIQSEERKGRFIWPDTAIITDNYALLSKSDFHVISPNEIPYVRVGLPKGTAYTESFKRWFPDHEYSVEYDSSNAAFKALYDGEVDMVMSSQYRLLLMTNYHEQPYYKANVIFDSTFNSTFGFNKDKEILCSVIDKALLMIDLEKISGQWMRKTYDYRVKIAQTRIILIVVVTALILGLSFLLGLILKNKNESNKLETLVRGRTLELEEKHRLLQIVNLSAAATLTKLGDESFENSLLSCMELLGIHMDVDRVQIWQNETINEELFFTLKYERDNTERRIKPVPIGLKFPYKIKQKWLEMFLRGEYINSSLRDLPPEDQEFLNLYEIKSIVIIPLFLQDYFWGFFSVDNCCQERIYSEEEINILHSASLMMASAVNRNKIENDLRVARDAAENSNYVKSVFLANISHEIRTPMNSIMGFSELALDDNIPQKTKDYLERIRINADWLLQIVNNILDISKIESGKMELENIPFDMHELFTSCRTLILPKAIEKGIMLCFYAEPSTNKRPLGDPTRLRQVLVNLLSNAVKFTNTGIIKLQAIIEQQNNKSITMYFEIKDSGIGMTTDQINKIFQPFMQAESGTTRKYGGTGLGLAITKSIVEMMGGKIFVESTPGLGSKFSFRLTFGAIDIENNEISESKIILNDLKKPTFEGEVLLCEDNLMNQQVICEHLTRVGLKTVVAENGRIGLDMIQSRLEKREKLFDLIFMDMHMPVMDGLEASAEIKKLNIKTPVVAMTANIMSSDMEIYEKSGMIDCVGKPFTSQELWRCLMRYFTPINFEKRETSESEREFMRGIKLLFLKKNEKKYKEIVDALQKNDLVSAHRIAHTLKSNAGQIGKHILQKAAEDVEFQLKDKENHVTQQQLITLEAELTAVLAQLQNEVGQAREEESAKNNKENYKPVDSETALEILNKLEPFLKSGNPDCRNLINDLRSIRGSEELIQQIEDFAFEQAMVTLAQLRGFL